MSTATFADVMESESGMEVALRLQEEQAAISSELNMLRGEITTTGPKIIYRPLQLQYWKYCERPHCRISGHVERRGYIQPGPHQSSIQGETLVDEWAKATHGTPLPQFGVYSSYLYDVDNDRDKRSTYWPLGAYTEYSPRLPFGEFTPMIDTRREGENAAAPGVHREPGGLHQFPIKQIREYGWHRLSIVKTVRPDACVNPDYACGWCSNIYAEEAHLISHTQSMHPALVANMMQANTLRDALVLPLDAIAAQTKGNAEVQALLAQVLSKVMSTPTNEPPRRGRPPGSKNDSSLEEMSEV